jgi:hypothetical protein
MPINHELIDEEEAEAFVDSLESTMVEQGVIQTATG